MKINTKKISLFLLLLSVALLIANCCISSVSEFDILSANNTCADISGHFEPSHAHEVEDNVIISEKRYKSIHLPLKVGFVAASGLDIKHLFISNIWQPPK